MASYRITSGLRPSRVFAVIACIAAVTLFFSPVPEGAPPHLMRAAGVVVLTIGLWATATVPEYFTTLIFFFLAMTFGIAPANVVFSGFHSGAIWMVLGGLVLGVAVQETGLGKRVARTLVSRTKGTYFHVIAGVVLIAMLLAFFIPSAAGRVVILLPIVLAVADRFGFKPGSNGYIAMSLAVGAGTLYPCFGILPAGVPNLGLMGAAESLYGIRLIYGEYLYLAFPVVGVFSTLVMPFLLCRLFPDTLKDIPAEETEETIGGLSGSERTLGVVLVVALAFWMTDFLHGISPAWVAMGASAVVLAPRLGVIPTATLVNRVNLGPWFFVAGVIGMGAVVVQSGLGRTVAEHLFDWVRMEPGNDTLNFGIVTGLGGLMGLVTGMPGQPAIMSALAENIATATGWPVYKVLMMQVPSWLLALFPYQLPPIVATVALARLPVAPVVKLLSSLCLFSIAVTIPALYLWWNLIGFL